MCPSSWQHIKVRLFYNDLVDDKGLNIKTLDTIHTIIYQIFELAVDEDYIRANPSSNAMKELKRTYSLNKHEDKREALTIEEQKLFLEYLDHDIYSRRIKPVVVILLYTGLRIGELTGLTWDDIDFENNTITVRRTLTNYKHADGKHRDKLNTPKTPSAYRTIPMLDIVKEAFIQERKFIEEENLPTNVVLDGVTNFVFINLNGNIKKQDTINQS